MFKPPYVRLTAINLNAGTLAWTVPLGDGPRQRLIELGVPDPGPLGGGAYTGPLVTKTLLFLGLRGNEAPDLVFGQTDPSQISADDATGPARSSTSGPVQTRSLGGAGRRADRLPR